MKRSLCLVQTILSLCVAFIVTKSGTAWADTPKHNPPPSIKQVGIVLADPIAVNNADSDFAAGCGRWLFFYLGGQPQFGSTSFWQSLERGRRELQKPNLQLSLSEAKQLTTWIGGTHFGVGTLSGGTRQTLRYRLYSLPHATPIAPEVTVSGTQAEIVAGLPALARKLSTQLGLASPELPKQVDLTPQEITQIGSLVYIKNLHDSHIPLKPVRDLAERSPLAGIALLGNFPYRTTEETQSLAKTLPKLAPNHPFVWGFLFEKARNLFNQNTDSIKTSASRYPNNYMFSCLKTQILRRDSDYRNAKQAAYQTIRCAPNNPDSWLLLGATISALANQIRHARYWGEMSETEQEKVREIYPEWENALRRATTLDPQHSLAWLRLATAATFNGSNQLADTAYQKALSLDKEVEEYYSWGFEMYDTKWNDNPEERRNKVAETAASTQYRSTYTAMNVAFILQSYGFNDHALRIGKQILPKLEQIAKESPEDGFAHYDNARGLGILKQDAEMFREYRKAARLLPKEAGVHNELVIVLTRHRRYQESLEPAQTCVRLEPKVASYRYNLGYSLSQLHRYPEAETALRVAVDLAPKYADAHSLLGEALSEQGKHIEAIAACTKAVEINPIWWFQRSLAHVYTAAKQPNKALPLLEEIVRFHADDVWANIYLSDTYLQKEDFKNAIKYMREIVRIMPKDGEAHLKLGNRLREAGDKEGARAAWKTANELDEKGDSGAEARKMIEMYP